jgi:hypothetical protein
MADAAETFILFNYRFLPWFDRGIYLAQIQGSTYLFMDDKAGEKQPWAFATQRADGSLVAHSGHEDELEWYRNKVRKWQRMNAGKVLYGDPFFNQWEWTEPKPGQEPFPVVID